jgi:hypothetical protein
VSDVVIRSSSPGWGGGRGIQLAQEVVIDNVNFQRKRLLSAATPRGRTGRYPPYWSRRRHHSRCHSPVDGKPWEAALPNFVWM